MKYLSLLLLITLSFSCSNENDFEPEINSNLPNGLQELLQYSPEYSFEKIIAQSEFDNSTLELWVAAADPSKISSFKDAFNIKLFQQTDQLLRVDGELNPAIEKESENVSADLIFFIGEAEYASPDVDYVFRFVTEERLSSANLRSIANWAYDIEIQSNNGDDYIGVTRLAATGTPSAPTDLSVSFSVKHGWLGSWYHVVSYVMLGNNEYREYCRDDVRRHKVKIYHNWYNYNVSYGTKSCN